MRAAAIKADSSMEGEVLSMFVDLCRTFGILDFLVDNAGVKKDSPHAGMTIKQ